jgi:hypothetical protein
MSTDVFDESNAVAEEELSLEDAMRNYAEAQTLEKKAKELKDGAKGVILKFMLENELDKQPTSMGVFSVGVRRSYEYSIATQELIKRVDEVKTDEEAKGIAECKELNYVLFKAAKE